MQSFYAAQFDREMGCSEREWLMWLRETKAKIEGVPVPELQHTLLSNWKNVVQSSEKLAKFYDKWAGMTDASKITSNGNADLIEEVDDEYSKKEGMSFRRIKQHLEEAIPIRAKMQPQIPEPCPTGT